MMSARRDPAHHHQYHDRPFQSRISSMAATERCPGCRAPDMADFADLTNVQGGLIAAGIALSRPSTTGTDQ